MMKKIGKMKEIMLKASINENEKVVQNYKN